MTKPLSKTQRIRKLIKKYPFMSTKVVAQKVQAAENLVHQVRSMVRKENREKAITDADKMRDAYRKKHPKIIEAWKELGATPEEEEAIQTILDKHANEVQVGGEHYKSKDIQPWDAIHAWGLGFFSGNVVKYVARHREKNGVEDLKKARHYLDKLIEIMEAK